MHPFFLTSLFLTHFLQEAKPTSASENNDCIQFYWFKKEGQESFEYLIEKVIPDSNLLMSSQYFNDYLEFEEEYKNNFLEFGKKDIYFPFNPYFVLQDRRFLGESKGKAIQHERLQLFEEKIKKGISEEVTVSILNKIKQKISSCKSISESDLKIKTCKIYERGLSQALNFFKYIKNIFETRILIAEFICKLLNLDPSTCPVETCQKINAAVVEVDSCIFSFSALFTADDFYEVYYVSEDNQQKSSLYIKMLTALLKIYLFYKPIEGIRIADFCMKNELSLIYRLIFSRSARENDEILCEPSIKLNSETINNDRFKEHVFNFLDHLEISKLNWNKDNVLSEIINDHAFYMNKCDHL